MTGDEEVELATHLRAIELRRLVALRDADINDAAMLDTGSWRDLSFDPVGQDPPVLSLK